MDLSLEKIVWSRELSLGSKIIDDDHKELFTIYNTLVDCIEGSKGNALFAAILSDMTDYSLTHFKKEEAYMESIGFPGLEEHKRFHKEYILKTAMFNSRFLSTDPPDLSEVVSFLNLWWRDHILRKDSLYEQHKRTSIRDMVVRELESNSVKQDIEGFRRFFKEPVELYGVKIPLVSKISASVYKKLIHTDKESVFSVCEELFRSGMMEESFIACNWSLKKSNEFEKDDFETFERWIGQYVTNWAVCDTFCNHTMGEFLKSHPEYISRLYDWCSSPNKWIRRASAVSLIVPAREGLFLEESFKIAGLLLEDKEDLVQKGYGWLLKVSSQSHQEEVFNFVMERRGKMPRTALRYAIEKMPRELRSKAMEKTK